MKNKLLIVFGITGLFVMNFMIITIYNVFTSSEFDLSDAAALYIEEDEELSSLDVDERSYWEGDMRAFAFLAHEGEISMILFKENLFGWSGEEHWLMASGRNEPLKLRDEDLIAGVLQDNQEEVLINGDSPEYVEVNDRMVWVMSYRDTDFPGDITIEYES